MNNHAQLWQRIAWLRYQAGLVMLFASFVLAGPAKAQLAYTFAAVQNATFSQSPSSSSIIAQTFDDQVFTRTLAPGFTFNGTLYTQIHISANGFITFGNAPGGTEYTPISSAAGYGGVIAPFASDLEPATTGGNNRRITFQQTGGNVVVQWQQVRRKGRSESFTFGIRLNVASGEIRLEYGSVSSPDAATDGQPQVGLRGTTNNFSIGNVMNRLVGTGSETWQHSLDGTTNAQTARFTSTAPAQQWNLGLNYIYTPCSVGQACDDGTACTINDMLDATCNCVGTFQDSDNDGVCDADDGCPLDPNKVAPGLCGCANLEPDSVCDDGDPNTENDVVGANCICAGTPISNTCTELAMDIVTDHFGAHITWDISDANTETVLCSGGPYANGFQQHISVTCCVPDGCHVLSLYDSAGDGMLNGSTGGYTLRTAGPESRRIIDNARNGDFGALSRITGIDHSFCLPMGDDRLIYTSCDKYWWRTNEYIVARENAAVAAEWVAGGSNSVQSATSGYEFWFYAPNGNYSFRKFRSHNVSDGFGNVGSIRTCHLRINNWSSTMHIPQGVLMNVKIRGRVEGNNLPWGAACRFVRDEDLALCPPTKLMDIPGNQFLSCDQFRTFERNQRIHARPVSGATQYQWRFQIPADGVLIVKTSTTYYLDLGWTVGPPLEASKTYSVDVRAMRNGSWCGTNDPWGDICSLTIGSLIQGGSEQLFLAQPIPGMRMWPNPNVGDQLWIDIDGLEPDVNTASLVFIDLTGKRGPTRTMNVHEGALRTSVDLPGDLAAGIYLVQIIAGNTQFTERLVIRR